MKPFLIAAFMILWLSLGPANKAQAQIVYGYSVPLDDGGADLPSGYSSGAIQATMAIPVKCTRGATQPGTPSIPAGAPPDLAHHSQELRIQRGPTDGQVSTSGMALVAELGFPNRACQ
jgi:hypothetical protein